MQLEEDLVSIIIPVYNAELYINQCIQSIVEQSYQNIEIILVDDGSTDNSPNICDNWGKKDSRIVVIHKKNAGSAAARNSGIKSSKGKYISFVDADDCIDKQMIEILLNIAQDEQAEIVECNYINFSTERPNKIDNTNLTIGKYTSEEALRLHIADKLFKQVVWNKLYLRALLVLFEEGKTIDDEFWTYKIIGNCKNLIHIDFVGYYYRQQDSSIMHQKYSIKRLQAIEAKLARKEYIEEFYPNLNRLCRINLLGSSIYQGQKILKELNGNERSESIRILNSYLKKINFSFKDCFEDHEFKFWIFLGYLNFWGTCRLRNILNKGL